MDTTTVTTPNELEIRVERIFDAPRAHVFSVWTDPKLIPEWWGDGTVVEEMDVRPAARNASAPPSASSRASSAESTRPNRSVRTSQNTLRTPDFTNLGAGTNRTQPMPSATPTEPP